MPTPASEPAAKRLRGAQGLAVRPGACVSPSIGRPAIGRPASGTGWSPRSGGPRSRVSANIAEGSAKRGNREFRRFLDIAIGSLAEIQVYLLLAKELGYLTHAAWGELEALRDHTGMLTWGLYRSMQEARGSASCAAPLAAPLPPAPLPRCPAAPPCLNPLTRLRFRAYVRRAFLQTLRHAPAPRRPRRPDGGGGPGGAARGAARAARGRRQLRPDARVPRARAGARGRGRGAQGGAPRAAARQDRLRRAGRVARREAGADRLRLGAADDHPARRAAGVRQDDHRGQARAAAQAGAEGAVPGGRRRVPAGRGRSAGHAGGAGGGRRARRAGRHRRRRDRAARDRGGRQGAGAHRARGHRRPPADRRRHDGRAGAGSRPRSGPTRSCSWPTA